MDRRDNALLQERYYQGSVSGLKYYFVPKSGYQKKYAILGVDYGSLDVDFEWQGKNRRVPAGIAHFLEHILFEQEEGKNAFTIFPTLGASPNAYTSHTQTAYFFSCTDHFYKNLDLLLDFIHKPYFSEEAVNKEKGVISEEIGMEEDNPGWKAYSNLLKSLFVLHPLREDIAGTTESVLSITAQDLHLVHQAFYQPQNMSLIVVGDLDEKELEDFLEKTYSKLSFPFQEIGKKIYPAEPKEIGSKEISEEMDISQPYFLLGYKGIYQIPLPSEKKVIREAAIDFGLSILFGKSTSLFTELYDQQLIDGGFSFSHMIEKDYEYTLFGGETRDPHELKKRILSTLEKGKKNLDGEAFERIKNKALGRFLCSLDSIGFIANQFLDSIFQGFCPFDYPELVASLTLKEVEENLEEHLRSDNQAVSLLWPLSKEK